MTHLVQLAAALGRKPGRLARDGPASSSLSPKASVLLALAEDDDGEVHVLLTVRSDNLRTNPGEVACPGGKREKDDASDWHTALRESFEEIQLPPDQVRFVAQLDSFCTNFGVLVTPFVGLIPFSFKAVPSPSEVKFVFWVPLKVFLVDNPAVHKVLSWFDEKEQRHYHVHSFIYKDIAIWGLTASFILRLLEESDGLYVIPYQVHGPGTRIASWIEDKKGSSKL